MKARVIVTPQIELKLYKTESNMMIDVLSAYETKSTVMQAFIKGTITELNKINEIDIKI